MMYAEHPTMEERIDNIQRQLDDNPELRDVAREDIEELSKLDIKVPKEEDDDTDGENSDEDVE